MIRYRPFLNTDPPLLADIWQQQPPFRGQVSRVTHQMLEQRVWAKPFFDRAGLILAIDDDTQGPDDTPLGFVHAGFAPNENLNDLDPATGIIAQIKVAPGEQAQQIGADLIQHATDYLKQRGSSSILVGSKFPYSPFYLGLYGGSHLPGVMEEDKFAKSLYDAAGFKTFETVNAMQLATTGYRAKIDRDQIAIGRQYHIKASEKFLESTWWENCTYGLADRHLFSLSHKRNRTRCGSVKFWDVEPLATQWGEVCRGLYDLKIDAEVRRKGMATFLVCESIKHLSQQGVTIVEAQVRASDEPSMGVFCKLGFEIAARGFLMSKSIG